MPPKKKAVEPRVEEESELVDETSRESADLDLAGRSPASSASSVTTASSFSTRSSGSLSAEQLERILEANAKTMMAMMDRMGAITDHSSPSSGEGSRAMQTRVDIPKWVEGETPSDFFSKYEQALSHNGVEKSK